LAENPLDNPGKEFHFTVGHPVQLYGLLFLWKHHEVQASNFTIATLATQRSSRFRKLRRLSRKGGSSWFILGRTDQWWENILNGEPSREKWKKVSE